MAILYTQVTNIKQSHADAAADAAVAAVACAATAAVRSNSRIQLRFSKSTVPVPGTTNASESVLNYKTNEAEQSMAIQLSEYC